LSGCLYLFWKGCHYVGEEEEASLFVVLLYLGCIVVPVKFLCDKAA
jgi:hypothetical protein